MTTPQERMEAIAREITASKPMRWGNCFNYADWRSAAEYALDSGDWSEFASMLADEDAWDAYHEYADRFYTPEGSFPPLEFEEWRQSTPMQRES